MPRLHLIHVARIQVVSTCIPCRNVAVYVYPISATKLSPVKMKLETVDSDIAEKPRVATSSRRKCLRTVFTLIIDILSRCY